MHVSEQMDLRRHCSSSIPDYSEDTFTSFSEGEEETYRQYENDPFESYYSGEESECRAVLDLSESIWQSSSQNDEGVLGSLCIFISSSFNPMISGRRLRSAKMQRKAEGGKTEKGKRHLQCSQQNTQNTGLPDQNVIFAEDT